MTQLLSCGNKLGWKSIFKNEEQCGYLPIDIAVLNLVLVDSSTADLIPFVWDTVLDKIKVENDEIYKIELLIGKYTDSIQTT